MGPAKKDKAEKLGIKKIIVPNEAGILSAYGLEHSAVERIAELQVDLPPTAIGKDYVDRIGFQAVPSNTGFQFSARGYFAITLALDEGIEINLLGATYGVDLYPLALKLPCIGRIGF